jgi:hypothetical protein
MVKGRFTGEYEIIRKAKKAEVPTSKTALPRNRKDMKKRR